MQLGDAPLPSFAIDVPPIEPVQRYGLSPEELSEHELERRECEQRMRDVLAIPAAPRTPTFDAQRARMLVAAKADPGLFVRAPEYRDALEDLRPWVAGYRELINRTKYPWTTLKKFLPIFINKPKEGRQTLLKDGYLFADNPELAHSLTSLVRAEHLFGHDRIWIQRGERVFHAERKRSRYYYVGGPLDGQPVRLLHLDRLGHGQPPKQALHRDLRSLEYRLHFSRMKIRHVTDEYIVANLEYGQWWVPSLLKADGARLDLQCEIVDDALVKKVEAEKRRAERRQRAVEALRRTIIAQVDEELPFDEPRREWGFQHDGRLRKNWRYAYFKQRELYAFNGDSYFVFDREGRPFVPQVCVDFLTDTFERTSGSWWRPKGQKPGREVGLLDFDTLTTHREELRQVPGFLGFAKEHPEWFDVFEPPERDWIQMRRREKFIDYLLHHREEFQSGDIVMIKGFTPWDPIHAHYHSFFIYETDPVTGIPIVVAGNAGRPSLRAWEIEARRTPKRAIHHRIRPKVEWLESIIAEPVEGELLAPPL